MAGARYRGKSFGVARLLAAIVFVVWAGAGFAPFGCPVGAGGADAAGCGQLLGVTCAYADEGAESVQEARFGPWQAYGGVLYVGDVRTNAGDKTVTAIPASVKPPVTAERFLFSDGNYYYVENFPGNGSGAVKLHRIEMRTGTDTVLSDDVLSGSDVFFEKGKIAYMSYRGTGSVVSVVDGATGAVQDIDFGSGQGLARLVGFHDNSAYLSRQLHGSDSVLQRRALGDSQTSEAMRLDSNTSFAGIFDGVVVTLDDVHVTAYDLNGTKKWWCVLPQSSSADRIAYDDGNLYFDTSAKMNSEAKYVGRISLQDGDKVQFSTGLPYIYKIMYANKDGVYFCATEDSSTQAIMSGSFNTYACGLESGKITNFDGPSASAGNAGSASTASPSTAPTTLGSSSFDVHNVGDYHAINLFLSNFAEWSEFWQRGAYDGDKPDMNQVVNWAFWHYVLNNDTLVSQEVEVPGTTNGHTATNYEPSGGSIFNRYTDTAGVENAIRNYLGLNYSLSGYRGGYFAESDGKIYESAMRGSASPKGYVALAESASDVGGGKVKIDFSIYPISLEMISDDKWYGMMPTVARIEAEKNSWGHIVSAHAVVSVDGKPGNRSFVLRSFKADV